MLTSLTENPRLPVLTQSHEAITASYSTSALTQSDDKIEREADSVSEKILHREPSAVCPCGGGCPRCMSRTSSRNHLLQAKLNIGQGNDPLEQEADRVADQIVDGESSSGVNAAIPQVQRAASTMTALTAAVPANVDNVLAGAGSSLEPVLQREMSQRFGHDFSSVRVHTGSGAEQSAADVHAKAYTVGNNVVFGAGQYSPDTSYGKRLIAHELTHVVQQSGDTSSQAEISSNNGTYLARTVDDWLTGSVNVSAWTYTQLVSEIDELSQYMDRQTASSPETTRIEEALAQLRAEVNRRETAAAGPRSAGRGRGRSRSRPASATATTASAEPLPARYPRVLTEMTSVAYADPAEMRTEYDLIMQWLARSGISESERRILTAERDNLAPQFLGDRERVRRERHAARVSAALTPDESDVANALEQYARTIQGISPDPSRPGVYLIFHQNEQVAISSEQYEQLRHDLADQLQHATRQLESRNSYYWDRYNSQLAINRDAPIIAGITGWLADVEDPGDELRTRYFWSFQRLRTASEHLRADRMVEAAAIIGPVERVSTEIRELSRAFYEGHIEGAETAISRLEFTRDASFAVAGSIAAVVAAPVVAGYVAGTGATGALATGLTVAGTGATVGTGMGLVRGTASAGGELLAGGSLSQAVSAFGSEFARGFREGAIAGAAGGAGRLLGLAAGATTSVTEQVLIRVGGDFVVNATTTMLDVLWQTCSAGHCDVDRAVRLGITNGLTSIPGSIVGLSNSAITRNFFAPLTAGATSYVGAIASGATPEEAMRGAGVAVASNLAMSRAAHGSDVDAALEARGRALGESHRETAAYATRRVAAVGGAVLLGTADALPPLRSGYGGTSMVIEGDAPGIASVRSSGGTTASVDPVVDTTVSTRTAGADMETTPPVASAHPSAEPETTALATAPVPDGSAAVPVDSVAPTVETEAPAVSAAPHAEAEAPAAATTAAPHAETETTSTSPASSTAASDVDGLNVDAAFSETAPYEVSAPRGARTTSRYARIALTAIQRLSASRLIGQRFGSQLRQAWNQTRNARELADIQQIQNLWASGSHDAARTMARAAYDRHRTRFWRAVRRDPALRQIFTDAGMTFVGGGGRPPVYTDPATGDVIDFMSLEHSTRLTDDPTLALDGGNLQTVLGYENSATLEGIRRTDEFQ